MLPVISWRLTTGIPVIHIFQRSWPNPSPDPILHSLPFHNQPNLQQGASGRRPDTASHTARSWWPQTTPSPANLPGWLASLRWPWLPNASTRSLRDGLRARLASRVTPKTWAEGSLRPRSASQGRSRWAGSDAAGIAPHGPAPRGGQAGPQPTRAPGQPPSSPPHAEISESTATYFIPCLG